MKYWIHFLIVLIIGLIFSFFTPWWIIAIIALLSAYLYKLKFWLSGLYGLLSALLLWGLSAFYIDIENNQILSSRMGELFGGLNSVMLILITGIIGGLLAAFGSMAGASIREFVSTKK